MKRRVLCVTAIRSEYFFQRPIFRAIMDHPALELELVVSGAHLSPLHDYSARLVEADGFPIVARIDSLLNSDTDASRIKGAATQLQVLAHVIDERRPDWLLAAGDREEAMLLALCGVYMNIPVAHYAAGDIVVGNVDDTVRHAVSRLAHLFLTTNEEASTRLIAGGESARRVHTVGHTGIDRIRATRELPRDEIARQLGVRGLDERYAVIVQHPISSAISDSAAHVTATLEAVREVGIQAFVSYPNSDAGSQPMINVIDSYRDTEGFHIFRNIPDEPFVNLLRNASVLLGNSSLGVLEGPYLRLPVLNVGARQMGRLHAENLMFVAPDKAAIVAGIRSVLDDAAVRDRMRNCGNPYGEGRAGERVAELLAATVIDAKLLNKEFEFGSATERAMENT